MLKGALHVHSTYSDGEFTLAELREIMLAAGCDFVFMTDHAEHFDEAKLAAYVRECRSLSDDRFRFIAGLEYTCLEHMHVLGFGVASLVATKDPQKVISHIKSRQGLAVIAHPMDSMFDWIETFEVLPDGIETWNTKYDGRYAPRPGTFYLLNRLQRRKPQMRAFYGMDLHWKKQHRGIFNVVDCESTSREPLLNAFASGNYFAVKGDMELLSSGELSAELIAQFSESHGRSDRFRCLVKLTKRVISRLGLTVPGPVKSHLRRIF